MIQLRSQSFNSTEGVQRTGDFVNGEEITGDITFIQTLSEVSFGQSTPPTLLNTPVSVRGKVTGVTDNGEITRIIVSELDNENRLDVDLPRTIQLQNTSELDSYILQAP